MGRPNTRSLPAATLGSVLLLLALPALAQKSGGVQRVPLLFQTSDRCIACHNGLTTASGEDVSIGFDWRPTIMANSSRDPYWQAGVRREMLDHPAARAAIEDECAICHMPMTRYQAKVAGGHDAVFAHLPFDPGKDGDRFSADGVSCSLCHQITPEKLGTRDSFVGGFVVNTTNPAGRRAEYGQWAVDAGHARVMMTSSGGFVPIQSAHVQQAELCATCHTLYTQALGPQGQVVGELPEQVPYQEWLHSAYKDARTCQSCHMPAVSEPAPITRVFGDPREPFARHVFAGGNFFVQHLLDRFRGDLDVGALPQELDAARVRTVDQLKTLAASVAIAGVELRGDRLEATVTVRNAAGHKLPTAYPSRRAWLHVTVTDGNGRTVFESGALEANGSIRDNDNDEDAGRFEPHYSEITSPGQVQIYEAVMADGSGRPTTGLLSAVRFVKDNRLLPAGFDKGTADKDVAVQGDAARDAGFDDSGHRIRYAVNVDTAAAPFRVNVELWYQPIAYRWAQNLKSYDAFEPKRFVGYYEALAASSAVRLDQASATR